MGEIIRVTVRGRVQGVGFRYYTRDEAARLGVAGWVRNLPNGDVEVVARVTPARKQRLLAALQAGPPL
ncbi:MAG: acylphosphatase, partial [Gammaproteobacteria bacterium]|nr:acylphosphatase [Gammaproteobacteria bacterium]NIR98699.1 acylphosphatase [Gammaproteobacteria bacterium]NIT64415.1 acylphosphatase [Gammaproteobacteria bacterium]NIV21145.1 acylphosphatase [Gammaproteobacteria bacterium]NIY32995.1 acylphosphatase [Gammaproteobacteria bacterium]